MELSNQHYLGNDHANPFYYNQELSPLGIVDGQEIYEGDCSLRYCDLEDRKFFDASHPEYVDIPF